jgi:glycyl-tRNA synthetase beta chain
MVLRPRLEDARFYWEEDVKRPLDERLADLERVVFMGGLGSLLDKSMRLMELVDWLAPSLELDDESRRVARRAAELSKCDQTTMMVGDTKLGSLQGIMGGYYAREMGEPEAVCQALAEHYLPAGPDDSLPATTPGWLVSVADKLDNLAAAFFLGMEPTGSADPQALRRQAQSLVRLLRVPDRGLNLSDLIDHVLQLLPPPETAGVISPPEAAERLLSFIAQRLEVIWDQEGISYDLTRAVLAVPWEQVDEVSERAAFLQQFRGDEPERFAAMVTAAERPARIRRPAGIPIGTPVDEKLFSETAETELQLLVSEVEPAVHGALSRRDFPAVVECLLRFVDVLDEFFDQVMIMVDDDDVRRNRLALMAAVDAVFLALADMTEVVEVNQSTRY